MARTLSDAELEIIENGEDDWVLFAHIMGIVEEASGHFMNDSEAVETASSACLELCDLGLARLGRYTDKEAFIAWPETGVELQQRLRTELSNPPLGSDMELNLMRIMLDILPEGLEAWRKQAK